jgi:hypothetical protein
MPTTKDPSDLPRAEDPTSDVPTNPPSQEPQTKPDDKPPSTKHRRILTTKPRWPHILFALVWLITAYVFIGLALDAHRLGQISLPRTQPLLSTGVELTGGAAPYSSAITLLAAITDDAANRLEERIHDSAHTLLWLNIVSICAAALGFAAQVGEYLHESRRNEKPVA